ncbi:FxsB family radical SAM/SPASM domain protein [Frankia sp. AgB1.9]|uniref:FxsB family cyclophane-forming radical SAM/SPASM peptide maturase n=1 Tax=unclassified Frankia TaxID=2632575 RepID=UPI001933C95F|nr:MULTISPECIES: FxsB family cyclophane-forming radical SAM/SPASM peptide maturase [unclassified Frankia]MBL7492425.1 FxsB family radical SAM/SPASM domain protein [Frankia sp. AgW1.1]MBL7549383.1 FxsB family radical SAM/SPASM domain protein [Frankia sp. AgB1.9]MBL7623416.1 FxsB family radical SAM/SPASM domain protein [Frankia sp. AgB1.8]
MTNSAVGVAGMRTYPTDLSSQLSLSAGRPGPEPFRQFVLKVVSRCNLACDYCYVYEMADQSWRERPVVMAADILARVAHRIGEHAEAHRLSAVRIVLHGGEPLLAGARWLDEALTALRAAIPARVDVQFAIQTNAVLLDETTLAVLHRHAVRVGVSLDGPVVAHDRHRRFADGRGSHARVAAALDLLGAPAHRALFSGLLCVVDLANDPLAVYDELLGYSPPTIDFLLPHGTWSAPPPGRRPDDPGTPYADWLIAIFDRWYEEPRRLVDVRLFSEIIQLLLGGASETESVGLTPSTVLVVETDGMLEQVDALKAAYDGAAATGLSVADGPLDLALRDPAILSRQAGVAALAAECRSCEVRDTCGGGFYPHRYRTDTGFDNPSVYCPDLLALVRHIRGRVRADLARVLRRPR